jgi:hypothetical protein
MHDANGLLSFQGWLLISICGIALLAMGCVVLAYLLVKFSAEDRDAMDRETRDDAAGLLLRAGVLLAQRGDDPERSDDATGLGALSQVQSDLTWDLTRRPPSSINRRIAESREGRPVPPAAA